MKLFACDLDNTLIFSRKKAPEGSVCVERIGDKEQGFMSPVAIDLLRRVSSGDYLFLPVTTRSVEQYRRIEWPQGCTPRYAVTANGAILLKEGEVLPEWSAETRRLFGGAEEEIARWQERLTAEDKYLRCRIVDDFFLFAYAKDEEDVAALAEGYRAETELDVAYSGRKIYFFPKGMNKGSAVERFLGRGSFEKTISAGDSAIDLSMLARTEVSIVPSLSLKKRLGDHPVLLQEGEGLFSDFVLSAVLKQ